MLHPLSLFCYVDVSVPNVFQDLFFCWEKIKIICLQKVMRSNIVSCHEGMDIKAHFLSRQIFYIAFICEPCSCLSFDLGYSSGHQQLRLFSIGSQTD